MKITFTLDLTTEDGRRLMQKLLDGIVKPVTLPPITATEPEPEKPAPTRKKRGSKKAKPAPEKDPTPEPETAEVETPEIDRDAQRKELEVTMREAAEKVGLSALREAMTEHKLPRLRDAADEDLDRYQTLVDELLKETS